jgi:deoxyribonuclease V
MFNIEKAINAQILMSRKIIEKKLEKEPKTICGMDISYKNDFGYGVAVILSYPDLKLIDVVITKKKPPIPYIPTFLGFREIPFLFELIKKAKSDLYIINGHGICHPRRCGIATHFGVCFNVPTIGIAKKLIKGFKLVNDNVLFNNEIVGKKYKNFYISIGNLITLEDAFNIIKNCTKYSLPEPLRLAHNISKNISRDDKNE